MSQAQWFLNPLFSGSYSDKVRRDFGPYAYWPLWEAGGAVTYDISGNAYNGVPTAVVPAQPGIGDGNLSTGFDGANSYITLPHNSIEARFNGDEGSLLCWFRALNAGVWTDGADREPYRVTHVGTTSYIYFRKAAANNTFTMRRVTPAGGVTISWSMSPLTWQCGVLTWSVTANQTRSYINGAEHAGGPQVCGAWNAPVDLNTMFIGAVSAVPVAPFQGWIAHVALFDYPFTPAQVLGISSL